MYLVLVIQLYGRWAPAGPLTQENAGKRSGLLSDQLEHCSSPSYVRVLNVSQGWSMGCVQTSRCEFCALSQDCWLRCWRTRHGSSTACRPSSACVRGRAQASSCGFLYFQRGLLAALLADVAAHPAEARRLPLIMAAYGDAHGLLERATGDATALKKVPHVATHSYSTLVDRKLCTSRAFGS